MKRFLIFTVLFSPLVLLIFLAIEPSWYNTNLLPSMLKDVYLFGLVPACVLAGVDWAVSGNRYLRLLGAALAGAAAVMLVLIVILFGGILTTINGVLMAALLGAVPAAACSWLTDKSMRS